MIKPPCQVIPTPPDFDFMRLGEATTMPRSKRNRFRPSLLNLEERAVPAVDPVGTFANIEGRLALPNQATTPRLNFDRGFFRYSPRGTVAVKIIGTASDGGDLTMGPAAFDTLTNPTPTRPSRVVPSVHQFPAGRNSQIVNFKVGKFTFPISGGWSNRVGTYHVALQLVGDANGDYQVNQTDIRLIQGMIRNPASVSSQVYASADYDGNGTVNNRDLSLARQNINVFTTLRPLKFQSQFNAPVTVPFNGYVRTPTASILMTGSPNVSFIATNLTIPSSAEVGGMVGASGAATTTLPLRMGANAISVSGFDGFGQSIETSLTIERAPIALVIVPDVVGSVPVDTTQAGLQAYYGNLGVPQSSLDITAEYTLMLSSLIGSGYVLNRDLFYTPYDWRIQQAPVDATPDGTLSNLTASVLTQTTPAYQVSYFGNTLANMVINDPTITTVDVVGVASGSMLARSYVQSPSLGVTFTRNSNTYTLPSVDSLIMVNSPMEGIPQFFNAWNGNYADAFYALTANIIANVNLVYAGVAAGTSVVNGPGFVIDKASITDPNTQQPSPLLFGQQYFAYFRQSIADYDFLSINGVLGNVNSDPLNSPNLLLDLNAGSTTGNNPWLSRVNNSSATFGITVTTVTQLNQQTGVGGTVWPLGQAAPIPTIAGQIWYQAQTTTTQGNGVTPIPSLFGRFPGDPRINIQVWGSPGVTPPPGISFTPTNFSVSQIGLINNRDFLDWLKLRLTM